MLAALKDCSPLDTYTRVKEKSYWMISFASLPLIIMLLSPMEYIIHLLLLPVDDVNLSFIIRLIFYLPDFLRSSIRLFTSLV